MILDGETRGADAAVWRRSQVGPSTGRFRRVPPVLAVEVAGEDDDEASLRNKARWYLERGVSTVWILLPETREAIVVRADGESRHRRGETLPEPTGLAGLAARVDALFAQIG